MVQPGDLRRAVELREALRAALLANNEGVAPAPATVAVLNRIAERAKLVTRFDEHGDVALEPASGGVDGALGRLLAIVYDAMGTDEWRRLKVCRNDTCLWAFYDTLEEPLAALVQHGRLRQPGEGTRLPAAPEGGAGGGIGPGGQRSPGARASVRLGPGKRRAEAGQAEPTQIEGRPSKRCPARAIGPVGDVVHVYLVEGRRFAKLVLQRDPVLFLEDPPRGVPEVPGKQDDDGHDGHLQQGVGRQRDRGAGQCLAKQEVDGGALPDHGSQRERRSQEEPEHVAQDLRPTGRVEGVVGWLLRFERPLRGRVDHRRNRTQRIAAALCSHRPIGVIRNASAAFPRRLSQRCYNRGTSSD